MPRRTHHQLHSVALVLLVALGLLATGGLPVVAQDATPAASGTVLSPDAMVDGLSLGEWHARWFQWWIGLLTPDTDPMFDETGARCAYGQHGPVFFLHFAPAPHTVERSCAVPTGVILFVPLQNVECSTVEPDPYYGRDEAELRTCAAEHIDIGLEQDLPLDKLTVDGQVVDIAPYRAPSPLSAVDWPADNEASVPAGVSLSVADGYAVMVGPLSSGVHTIETSVSNGAGAAGRVTYRLTASSGATAATPEA